MAHNAIVSYDAPVNLPDPSLLSDAARRLVQLPEAGDRDQAVQTVFKLVDAVLVAPDDFKKRRVKKANEAFHRKVGRHPPAIDFLHGAGFEEGDDPDVPGEAGRGALLSMPVAFIARLTDAHHTLALACREAGVAAPPLPGGTFNPYQSNFQQTDTTNGAKAPAAWKSEAARLHDEVKKRNLERQEKVESAPAVDLKPTVFWLAAGRKLEEVVRETAEPAAEDRVTDNALLQSQLATAKAAISGSNGKFESADKRRLAELSRTRVHEFCILRVICPDKAVLQVHFRARDTGEHVRAQLAPLLAPHVRGTDWYIYQSPPLKRLQMKESLASAGFTPGANVYLGFGGCKPDAPYLDVDLASQLGPQPEGQRGVNAASGPTFSGEAMGWGVGQRLGGGNPPRAAAVPHPSPPGGPE